MYNSIFDVSIFISIANSIFFILINLSLANNLDNWVGYRYSNSNYGELSYLINLDNIAISQPPYSILNQYDHYCHLSRV